MDVGLLKTFLEVSKTRHFSRAADNLFVTSAAVSARIKLLESQLGVQLFIRHRGNMQLTNEGERLIPLAETMINTWFRALQEVGLPPEQEARIHIGATSGMWLMALQEKLIDLMAQKPELAIQAEGHSNEDLARLLLDRTLDLVLLSDPPATSGFRSVKLGVITLVLASGSSEATTLAEIQDYIYIDWGTAFANFFAKKFGDNLTPILHVNLASIAVSLIEKKGGAAYLPTSTVNSLDYLHQVKDAPTFRRPVYACYQEANVRLDLVKELVGFLDGVSI